MELRRLQGKTIEGIKISTDKTIIELTLRNEKPLWLRSAGDCCNKTWFEHINGIHFLLGRTIIGVELYETLDANGHPIVYLWVLKTTHGRCDLEMRNDTKGFYGGSLELWEKFPPQDEDWWDENGMAEVTDDF